MPSAFVALCAVSDVEEDTPLRATHEGQDYAVFVKDGAYYVTQDLCTHGPGLMSDGWVEGTEVECPFHQGRFDFTTGAVTSPPCTEPLRVWTAHVQDEQVCIDPAERRG